MSKRTGLGDNAYVDGYDLSGFVTMLGAIRGGPAALDVTTINQSAMSRLGGLRDGGIDFTSLFAPDTDEAHDALSGLPTTDRAVSYFRGTTLGNPTASVIAKQIDYAGTRDQAGMFTFGVSSQANHYGLTWGRSLTAGKRTDTTATDGASIDTTASADFGWCAFLHVFAVTGTNVTVTLQDSADDSSFSAITGGAFTAAAAAGSQRLAAASSTATVRRYVRAVTTGTFTSATFAVAFVKGSDPGLVF